MTAFIDTTKDRRTDGLRWGIEPICAVLQVAPSTYWSANCRPPSKRWLSDAVLAGEVRRVFDENMQVYGVEKIWCHLLREGHTVGIASIRRGRKVPFSTIPGTLDGRPDKVKRNFTAPAPNCV